LEDGNNCRRSDKKPTDYKDANRQTPPPLNAADGP
jgi:hypothetical protein